MCVVVQSEFHDLSVTASCVNTNCPRFSSLSGHLHRGLHSTTLPSRSIPQLWPFAWSLLPYHTMASCWHRSLLLLLGIVAMRVSITEWPSEETVFGWIRLKENTARSRGLTWLRILHEGKKCLSSADREGLPSHIAVMLSTGPQLGPSKRTRRTYPYTSSFHFPYVRQIHNLLACLLYGDRLFEWGPREESGATICGKERERKSEYKACPRLGKRDRTLYSGCSGQLL